MRVPVLLCVLLCVSAAPGPVSGAGADKSCTDLRQFYTGKGFTLVEVPQTEISEPIKSDKQIETERLRLAAEFPRTGDLQYFSSQGLKV
ncbi:hypothetical protein JOQ06_006071, partial [Pogonophryne albipinna]